MDKGNYIEREIKIRIEDSNKISESLKDNGAEFLGKCFQRTIRFDTPDLAYEKKGTFFRVRSGRKNIVTMKKKIKNKSDLLERLEIETEVKEIEPVKTIFNELGLSKEFIMEKYRSDWKLNNTLVSIDRLPFGNFIEIEGDETDIMSTVSLLGLDVKNKISVTYWDVFDEYKEKNNIEEDNIVFSNVENVNKKSVNS